MDVKKLIGDKSAALPRELEPVIEAMATGELKSLVVIGEYQDGTVKTMWQMNMHDGASNELAIIGALELIKHELLFGSEGEESNDE